MRTLLLCFLLLASPAVWAGDGQPKYKSKPVKKPKAVKTASGLEYTITSKGNGPVPVAGDKVVVHYTGTLTDGKKFESSLDRGEPFSFVLGRGQVIKGWEEGFALLHAGDKATFRIPAALAYGPANRPGIPPNSDLVFEVELVDVVGGVRPWVTAKGMDTVKTSSGLKYIVFESHKDSVQPGIGDDVKMHYSGFFLDGKVFDSSVERGQPLPLVPGLKMVIPGWEEAVALMHKGDKLKLIIPPALAYGEKGYGNLIPPNSTLVFDVELVEVKKAKYDITGVEKISTQGGTEVYIIKHGDGAKCENNKKLAIHYSGYLETGEIFDSSRRSGRPYSFVLGTGSVIRGWDEGLLFARAGDKLRLVIPYTQAYGVNGRPPIIPPKANLIFDLEVVSVK